MFERERQVEAEKVKLLQSAAVVGRHHPHPHPHHHPLQGPPPPPHPPAPAADAAAIPTAALEAAKNRQLMGQLSPREFLQRIFPAVNPNVLELVWQGCGGDLERAIEQIVSNNSMSNLHAAHMAQQMALQQRLLAAQMAAVAGGKLPGGVAPPAHPGLIPHSASTVSGTEHSPVCQATVAPQKTPAQPTQGKPVGSSESAFTTPTAKTGVAPAQTGLPSCFQGLPVGHPATFAGLYSYQAAQAALLARMCPGNAAPNFPGLVPVTPTISPGQTTSSSSSPKHHSNELLAQKSAFRSHLPSPTSSAHSAGSSGSTPAAGSGSSGTPLTRSPSLESPQSCSDGAKSPIKFSVESIIGK